MTSGKRLSMRRERTPFEIVILVVSALACAAVIGGLVWAKAVQGSGPADLSVSVAEPVRTSGGEVAYLVRVRNDGGETAENVVIAIRVGGRERRIEVLSVARADEEEATVLFPPGTTGPAGAEIESYNATTRG